MAEENIDNTVNGSGLFNTKIPGLGDAADIQAALRVYHYGSYTYDGSNTNPSNLVNPSIAKHLQNLVDADALEVTNRNTAISTHNSDTTDVHGIPDTSLLATTSYVTDAINGVTGEFSTLAGNGIDWNADQERFDLEPRINNSQTVIEQTSSFILNSSDVSKTILLNTSSGMTLTIPANSSVEIPIGYQYHLIELGTGQTTFTPEAGVTINSKNSQMYIDARYGKATLIKIGSDSWIAYGDIYENVPTPTPVAPTPVAPTPVAPTPVAPTPVAPTPVAPTPVAPTPVAPTPVAPTPVAPTPVAPTPVAPTPVAPTPVASISGYWIAYCYNQEGEAVFYPASSYNCTTAQNDVLASFPGATIVSCNPGLNTDNPLTYVPLGCESTPTPTPVAPTPVAPTPVAPTPVALTTYYGCCTDSPMVSGQYGGSGEATDALNAQCQAAFPGSTLDGPVSTTPLNCTGTPTPVAPTPVAPVTPTPVAPTPVAPTPVAPTPVAPTPVAPTPVAPTPVAPTPVAPTPVALQTYYACCTDSPMVSGQYAGSSSAASGLNAQCQAAFPGSTIDGPVSLTPLNCSGTPTPVAPTPVAPPFFPPTPVAPTPVAPTPVAPTPVAPTPVAPTPVAPTPVAPPFFPFFPTFAGSMPFV